MNVLVIGGGGYLGSIVNPALESAHHATYLDLHPVAGAEDRTFVGDLADEALVARALEAQDAVVFMAMGIVRATATEKAHYVDKIDSTFDVNVRDQYRVLKIGLEMGIRKFILTSSMSVYGTLMRAKGLDESNPTDAFNPYGLSKRMAETLHFAAWQNYPDGVFVAARLNFPRNEADIVQFPYDPAVGEKNICALGPNDTRRLLLACLACEKPGCHIVNATGDVAGVRFPVTKATKLLGWAPRNE